MIKSNRTRLIYTVRREPEPEKPQPVPRETKPAREKPKKERPFRKVVSREITVDERGRKIYCDTLACGHVHKQTSHDRCQPEIARQKHVCNICRGIIKASATRKAKAAAGVNQDHPR